MRLLRELPQSVTADISRLLDAVPDPTIVTDINGSILSVNRSAANLLRYTTSDLMGLPLADLIRGICARGARTT